MGRTRYSLFYLAGYLLPSGLACFAAPQLALDLLLANGSYPDPIVRTLGVLLFALGVLITEIIRHRVEALYPATLVVRAIILSALASLYLAYRDPFFLSLIAVVGFGFVLTATCFWLDRRSRTPSPQAA